MFSGSVLLVAELKRNVVFTWSVVKTTMKRKASEKGSRRTEEMTAKKPATHVSKGTENHSSSDTNERYRRNSRTAVDVMRKKSTLHKSEVVGISLDQAVSANCNSGHSCGSSDARKLGDNFYDVPSEMLAKSLLGKVLVRRLENGTILRGIIVETESYPGGDDKGSVTFNGRETPKTQPLFMKPGTTWVYLTYGMYHCINISSQGPGAAVLLRAVDPLEGFDYMNIQRLSKRKTKKDIKLKDHELCSGPSKLCMSFSIDIPMCNKIDLCSSNSLWIEDNGTYMGPDEIITTTRIGIDSVGKEWAMKPYRFYIYGNNSSCMVLQEDIAVVTGIDQQLEAKVSG